MNRPEKLIVMLFGLPGSGKSYFASRLARRIHVDHLNSDQIRKELFPVPEYTEEEGIVVYEELYERAVRNAKLGRSMILDCTFYTERMRSIFYDLADDISLTLEWIEVWAQEKLIKERVSTKRKYSDANFEVYKYIKGHFEPLFKPHLMIESTNSNIDEMISQAIEYLQLKPINDN